MAYEYGPAVNTLPVDLREAAIQEAEAYYRAEYAGRTDEQYRRMALADVGMQISGGVEEGLIVAQSDYAAHEKCELNLAA